MRSLKFLAMLLIVTMLFCACSKIDSYVNDGFPDVYYSDGAIYLNGKVLKKADKLIVKRIDSSVVCVFTGEEYITVTPDGTTLTLSDFITDKEEFENRIKLLVDLQLAMRNLPPLSYEEYEKMMDELSSYEEAMKLDFFVDDSKIVIMGFIIDYSEPMVNEKYKPDGDLMCSSFITGKCISYFPEEIDKNEYKSLWVSDSMEIHNYEGTDYHVYKTRYQKETSYGSKSDDDIYYLVIGKVNENDERVIVGYKPIEEDYCCSFSDFVKTLNEINSKN